MSHKTQVGGWIDLVIGGVVIVVFFVSLLVAIWVAYRQEKGL